MMMHCTEDPATLNKVASELEKLRLNDSITRNDINSDGAPFPRTCLKLLRSIPGNSTCVDCGNRNPDWASVTYGVLLCTRCSGRHRSYGVATSRVRSITMDCWSHSQVLAMLEGGNEQLQNFYDRHEMGEKSKIFDHRYQTKAACFYRTNMGNHVEKIGQIGQWMGRAASRKVATTTNRARPIKHARPVATATRHSATVQ